MEETRKKVVSSSCFFFQYKMQTKLEHNNFINFVSIIQTICFLYLPDCYTGMCMIKILLSNEYY